MTLSRTTSSVRRHAIKVLASAPLLPLGAMSVNSLLAGCAASGAMGRSAASGAVPSTASFSGMAAPSLANPEAMGMHVRNFL